MTFWKPVAALAAAAAMSVSPAFADHHKSAKQKSDIVDTAIAAGSFNTLVVAVQAAGLEATLRSEGPFTVFAPTDDAFAKLPEGTVETLLKPENKDKLVSILTYHVIPGAVMSSDIAGKTLDVKTVEGSTASVDATDGVKIDGASVIQADIKTSNGVIHVIDAVIMP
ncbi:fasciclin domain-containing protein [Hyphococcus sp.]|jgi:uncharacterized surface protein with fasciclin (FAS1) repeats|uniref:fasciclin domain-containing protein n=1 Tax=Hyphococcus sp. TaxID=2038636 RepID=UPI003D1353ED